MNVKGGKALINVDKTIVDLATFQKGQKAMERIEMLYDGVPIIDNPVQTSIFEDDDLDY